MGDQGDQEDPRWERVAFSYCSEHGRDDWPRCCYRTARDRLDTMREMRDAALDRARTVGGLCDASARRSVEVEKELCACMTERDDLRERLRCARNERDATRAELENAKTLMREAIPQMKESAAEFRVLSAKLAETLELVELFGEYLDDKDEGQVDYDLVRRMREKLKAVRA